LWRLRAPGAPNEGARDFYLVRAVGGKGRIRTVLDWGSQVMSVHATGDALTVSRSDGSQHVHARRENSWRIDAERGLIVLSGGAKEHAPRPSVGENAPPRAQYRVPLVSAIDSTPGALTQNGDAALRFQLGEEQYRRSEQSWMQAGAPRADVAFAATRHDLHVDISVHKSPPVFARASTHNQLDNEHPDINSDGVQLYLADWSWLLVPEEPGTRVRITAREGAQTTIAVNAEWRLTANGYAMHVVVARASLPGKGRVIDADIIVNEISADRERRRGQLLLSHAFGDWIYLRGDRHDKTRFPRFLIENA
jgi:hypothetical protein